MFLLYVLLDGLDDGLGGMKVFIDRVEQHRSVCLYVFGDFGLVVCLRDKLVESFEEVLVRVRVILG